MPSDSLDLPAAEPEVDPDRVLVRLATAGDYDAIAEHFVRCFDEGWPPYDISCSVSDHVAWKLTADELCAEQQIIATLDDDPSYVIAMTSWVRRPIWIRGEQRVIIDVGDISVRPEWRMIRINQKRRDLRKALGHESYDLQMSWLPHHPARRKSGLRQPILGNRVLVLWKPASLRSLIQVPRRTLGWKHAARVISDALRHRFRMPHRSRFAGQLVDLERFDDRTDAMWEAAKPQFEFALERTQDYLNWRYADPRAGRFEVRAAVEDGTVIGYCVTKPTADSAEIVDLLVRPGRLDALEALVADAVARVKRESKRDLHCWLPQRHPYVATVRALWFYDSGRDPSLRYSGGVIPIEELDFLQHADLRVHVTEGDSDFV